MVKLYGEKTFVPVAGPQGPKGSSGEKGPVGPVGPQGKDGRDGKAGPIGPRGAAGKDAGHVGPSGPMGREGPRGKDGKAGPLGPKGPMGPQGARGPEGPQGLQGLVGKDGADSTVPGPEGQIGPEGPKGKAGKDGKEGPKGPKGEKGDRGQQGFDGGPGARGPAGASGSNATIKNEGSVLTAAPTSIDFVGAGVTASAVGASVTVTVNGGGGGSFPSLSPDSVVFINSDGDPDEHPNFTFDKITATLIIQQIDDAYLENCAIGSGCSVSNLSSPISIADGGTNAATAADARTSLGLAIGTNIQAWDADLDSLAAVGLTAAGLALLDDVAAVNQRATLGLVIGTNVQAYDAELAALAGLTSAADKLPYFTGSGTASVADFTAAGRALVDDAAASNQRTTLGLGTIATQDSNNVSISGGAVTGITDLVVADGGTGRSTLTAHGVLLGEGTSAINQTSAGTAGQVIKSGGASADPDWADDQAALVVIFDGGGSELADNVFVDISIPFACTITGVRCLADQSGSVVVGVWKDSYANYPPTSGDSIAASAKPTISTATKSEDTTLTGWTTSVSAGDTIRFNIDSCTTITKLTLTLKVKKA